MYLKPLFLGLCLAGNSLVSAHYIITELLINGAPQGPGKCLRLPKQLPDNDITKWLLVDSPDLACNLNGDSPAARVCPITAGDSIGFQYKGSETLKRIEHNGPVSVYMKKVDDSTKDPGSGEGWFKIYEDGFKDGQWCKDRINKEGGVLTVTIPSDLKKGHYLIRGEHIGLHSAAPGQGGAQFYITCGQLLVTSLGGDAKPQTVSIPGHIKSGDKSIVINIETADLKNYKVPGPKVYLSGGVSYPTKQAPLGDPMVCVTENENWCANPLGKYNSKEQCLKLVEDCRAQFQDCLDNVHNIVTTGGKCEEHVKVCDKQETICYACDGSCSGSFPAGPEQTTTRRRATRTKRLVRV